MRASEPDALDDLEIGMIADPLASPLWPIAKGMLHPALMRSDEDWPEVEADLACNANQIWAVLDRGSMVAAAVTRVCQTRNGEVAEVYLIGGTDHRRWIGALSRTIEESAREIGCVGMRAYGRIGWKGALDDLGWSVSAVAYQKSLTGEGAK